MSKKKSFRSIVASLITLVVALTVVFYALNETRREPNLEIFAFNLGSGRSVFIHTPDDERILIDGGSNSEVVRKITKILPFWSRRIDTVIATNSLGKNVGGLIEILNRYEVGEAIVSKFTVESLGLASSTDQIYGTFIERTDELGLSVKKAASGERLVFDLEHGIGVEVLFPTNPDTFEYSKTSAPEIILKITYGSTSFVIFGGGTPKIQKFIAASTEFRDPISALIVSNSATYSNTAAQAIEQWNPEFFVYSKSTTSPSSSGSGSKEKENPIASIPEANRYNIKEKGTVKIVSDGSQVRIETEM